MAFLTNEKLTIVGAAGMIGSNMVQTALTMGLTSDICLYDVFSPEGVAEEMGITPDNLKRYKRNYIDETSRSIRSMVKLKADLPENE